MNKKTILLVDDDQDVRSLLMSLLTFMGLDVAIAQTADEAISACDRKKFDLILMDWHMPGGDGFEASTKIWRDSKCNAETKIIICTASDTPSEIEACKKHGFADVFSKSFDRDSLSRLLSRHL